MATSFSTKIAVRGYHVYSIMWNARVGEVLYCERELDDKNNRFAVAVKVQDGSRCTVGHTPRELSRLSWHFLRRGGHITCKVTGECQRSPLHQGGLEVPCVVNFTTTDNNQPLLERLIEHFSTSVRS